MSYNRDSANDLVWNESSQSYVPAPAEYTCNRDTTIDIYEESLDPDTVYNVTDQQDNFINIIRDTIWPVGSIYFGMMETCPLAALFGTWVKISAGRVIQGADENHTAGEIIEPGLPNHTHMENWIFTEGVRPLSARLNHDSGAGNIKSIKTSLEHYSDASTTEEPLGEVVMTGGAEQSIYGNSSTVQPAALVVNIWQRIA